MRTAAIKKLTEELLNLHNRYLPGETDEILRKMDIQSTQKSMYSSPVYSLFTQTFLKNGPMGEEVFYSGIRSKTPLAIANFAQIDDVIQNIIESINPDNPYSSYIIGVGNLATHAVNHYVSLFAYIENDNYVISYFNPLPNECYNQYLKKIITAIAEYQKTSTLNIKFKNHAEKLLQDNEIYCAEYSSLYLYLSELEYNVKQQKYNLKTEHDIFFEKLNATPHSTIIEELKTKSAYLVFSDLIQGARKPNQDRIEQTMREMNLEYWAEEVSKDDLKGAVSIILDDIEAYYNAPARTQAERFIIALSVTAILAGFYIQTSTVSITGIAVIYFTELYELRIANDLRFQKEYYMTAIDESFMQKTSEKYI